MERKEKQSKENFALKLLQKNTDKKHPEQHIKNPYKISTRAQKIFRHYQDHDQEWSPSKKSSCELNHQRFFDEKKLKNFSEKKNLAILFDASGLANISDPQGKLMEKFLNLMQNNQIMGNMPLNNSFAISRKFKQPQIHEFQELSFSDQIITEYKKALFGVYFMRETIFSGDIENTAKYEISKKNLEKLLGNLQSFLTIESKNTHDFFTKIDEYLDKLEIYSANNILIGLEQIEWKIQQEIRNVSATEKCKTTIFIMFHEETLSKKTLYEKIEKLCSDDLAFELKKKIKFRWHEFNQSIFESMLKDIRGNTNYFFEKYYLSNFDSIQINFDSYVANLKNFKPDCKIGEINGEEKQIRKCHFWYALVAGFRAVEEDMQKGEELAILCFLHNTLLEKLNRMMINDSARKMSFDEILSIQTKEQKIEQLKEYRKFSNILENSLIELETVYANIMKDVQNFFGKIADGEINGLVFWRNLKFHESVRYSYVHPIIIGIMGYYEKLKTYKKMTKETDSENENEQKYFYTNGNLPRITFINLDGFDNPMNYGFCNSLGKNLQIISVNIDGELKVIKEIEDSIKNFHKNHNKPHFFSIPMRTANRKNQYKIKSKDFWEVFNTIIFKLIEKHKPSLIVLSHSFFFYKTINRKNNIDLNPQTFSKIIHKLCLLSNYKIVLFQNINIKYENMANPIFKPEYQIWQDNFSFEDKNHLFDNRRYIYEMVGSFVNTFNGNFFLLFDSLLWLTLIQYKT